MEYFIEWRNPRLGDQYVCRKELQSVMDIERILNDKSLFLEGSCYVELLRWDDTKRIYIKVCGIDADDHQRAWPCRPQISINYGK